MSSEYKQGYWCPECKGVTSEPTLTRIRNPDESDWTVLDSCPDCGHDQLEECALCIDCLENGVDAEATIEDYCDDCAKKNFDPEDMEDFQRDRVQRVDSLLRDKSKETA